MSDLLITKRRWFSWMLILVGNIIYTFTVKLFLLPAQLISCGTTGIGLILQHLWNIPLTVFLFVFNVAMLILGWLILGRKFAMTTIFSSLFYPVFLEFLNRTLGNISITDDILMNTLFSGLGLGLSLGIVVRAGASTGGMDIPPLILNKFFRVPVSTTLGICDFCIMMAQMSFHPVEDLLYGLLLLITITTTLNKVLMMGTSKTEVKIISDKAQEIREGILSKVDRGCTMLHAEGGYLHNQTEVILSIISNYELPKIEKLARSIDPDCFMIISRVSEVWGRGFSVGKNYKRDMQNP